jgi:hypothetical protein
LPVYAKTAAAEIEMMPTVKKPFGSLRSGFKAGINRVVYAKSSESECPPNNGVSKELGSGS